METAIGEYNFSPFENEKLVFTEYEIMPRRLIGYYQGYGIKRYFESELHGEGEETYFYWYDEDRREKKILLKEISLWV